MTAVLLDLEIVTRDDGDWFQFTWRGKGDAWREALERIKREVPAEFREYDEAEQVWRVSNVFAERLADIFPNFAGALDALRSQLAMFEEAR